MSQTEAPADALVALDDATDRAVVGGKAAGLARARAAGHLVPDGVVVPVGAVVAGPGVPWEPVAGLVARLGGSVAVRSSAVDEDSAHDSYAGQYESILHVTDDQQLIAAIHRCRASAESAAVHSYAAHAHAEEGGIAVLIQRMVDPRAAGVAFSVDPVSGQDHVVIEATAGVGDAVLAGEVTGERWTVAGTPRLVGEARTVLHEHEAAEIAELCGRLRSELGLHVDIEWAIEDGTLHLLQVRPVTAVPVEPDVDLPEGQTFERDPRVHAPLNPLSFTSWLPLHGEAFTHTFARFGVPMETIDNRHLYGRVYSRAVPIPDRGKDGPPPPDPIMRVLFRLVPAIRKRMKAALRWRDDAALHALVDQWEQEGREWTRTSTRELRERDLAAMSDTELAGHFDDLRAHVRRVADDHFDLAVGGVFMSMGRLGMFVEDRLGWPVHDIFTLVQGYGHASTAHGDALRRLVADLGPEAVDAALADPATLLDHPAAQEYVEQWGHRVHMDLSRPTEAEQPSLIAAHLRRHRAVERVDRDPTEAAGAAADRARVALDPGDRRRFDELLHLARRARPTGDETEGTVLEAITNVRFAALEAARRLEASGLLRDQRDVFFLERDEVVAMLRNELTTTPDIARRKGEHHWAQANDVPDHLGPAPAMPDLSKLVPKAHRETIGALGWSLKAAQPEVPARADDGDALSGIPGSPGVVEGPVRIVRDPADFHKVQPGDIVVCPITQASWSPIFDVIGGLVTEQGGPLSHPATLAREYGIPCVLSVAGAIAGLEDGDLICVDGGAGSVSAVV